MTTVDYLQCHISPRWIKYPAMDGVGEGGNHSVVDDPGRSIFEGIIYSVTANMWDCGKTYYRQPLWTKTTARNEIAVVPPSSLQASRPTKTNTATIWCMCAKGVKYKYISVLTIQYSTV